ncbi:MAG: thermonuclease family protein [Candidatus Omnitrophica bacterium]|nr:thermonuclease family protein [Candidatus Omnitrophota bacterium]
MPKEKFLDNSYLKLILDISDIYQKAKLHTIQLANKIILKAYWYMGECIVEGEQNGNIRAQYGSRLLEHASRDLTLKFGKGFSVSNLNNMKQLYIYYPILQSIGELSWTKYQLLLTIKDSGQRKFYETKAIELGWSVSQLKEQLRLAKIVIEQRNQKRKSVTAKKIGFTRGRLYTYRLIKPKRITPESTELLIDCGFNFWEERELAGLKTPQDGQIVESVETESGYKFKISEATKKHLYTYKAFVESVVDADTIWVNIDLGFKNWARQKLRFRGIDAPELSTKKGERAKEFVEAQLSKVSFIIIRSTSLDKYGRPLSDIFYLPAGQAGLEGESNPQTVLERGVFLNQQLLDEGLAKLI